MLKIDLTSDDQPISKVLFLAHTERWIKQPSQYQNKEWSIFYF